MEKEQEKERKILLIEGEGVNLLALVGESVGRIMHGEDKESVLAEVSEKLKNVSASDLEKYTQDLEKAKAAFEKMGESLRVLNELQDYPKPRKGNNAPFYHGVNRKRGKRR